MKSNSTIQAKHDIEAAASEAVRVIASAASEAAKVVANATAEAVKVNSTKTDGDHDLIIRLDSKMDDLKDDIKDLSDGTKVQINDHENRLRLVEHGQWKWAGISSLSGVAGGIISIVVAFVLKFIH